jgi:hypothetical protein
MNASSVAPKYIPIVQKPKCCAVACLQMILYRNNFGLFDQEDLAIEFGVKVGADDKHAFRENMPTMTEFNNDEGISTLDSVERINVFFDSSKITLAAMALPFSKISSFKDLIVENLAQNNDIWIEYHTHEVHADDINNKRIHDALIESIDLEANTAVIIDPKPGRRQRATVPVDVLERALSSKFGRELGLLIVKKKTA